MKVKKISSAELDQVCLEWIGKGALKNSLDEFKQYNNTQSVECRAVIDANDNYLAIFELRTVVTSHVKSMDLLFSPDLDPDSGETLEEMMALLEKIVEIIQYVFTDVVNALKENLEVKIYNKEENVRTILYNFAKQFKENNKDCEIKIYKNWIHLLHKDS